MKIDINKDFETAYQQSIWKGLDLKQLLTVFCFLSNGNWGDGCSLVFLKNSAPGRRVHRNPGGISDSGFRAVQIPGHVHPYVIQRMEVSASNEETVRRNRK